MGIPAQYPPRQYDLDQWDAAKWREHKDELIWIPCKERLPEEDGEYLFTWEEGGEFGVTAAKYSTGMDFRFFYPFFTAWRHLPEAYQEGKQ